MRLQNGDEIYLQSGTLKVKELLGEGGQGEVYLASLNGKDYALKIYIDEVSSDFKYNLKNNILKGSPFYTFLWPKEVIELDDGTFGYLMDLRPKEYIEFCKYLNGSYYDKVSKTKVSSAFINLETKLRWCIELCKSFKKLHEMGYSYQDLNDGSFFLNKETGDLLICDNDNVTANQKNLGVLGKMRYMAPEIVRGEKMPDTHSDRFSLAIILFLALCYGNPFEGKCLEKYNIIDEASDMEMYGTNPIFIYHKTDLSNRPIRGYHTSVLKYWPTLPTYIKEAFHRTFVDGLVDRENERTTEIEWVRLLSRYRDELITCGCGNSYAFGLFETNKTISCCPHCGMPKPVRTKLVFGKNEIVIEPGKSIYLTDLDKYSDEYNKVIGKVIQNKNNPNLWGIKMDIDSNIKVMDKNGTIKEISKDIAVIPVVADLQIHFDQCISGEIKKI